MNDVFQQRVKAAAVAGWWTVLIAIGFLAIVWFLFLGLMAARPTWLQPLFGPGVSWDYVQNVGFWAISIFKMCVWLIALMVVWLTLWARQLPESQTMNPDRRKEIEERWAAIDRELADLGDGKVVSDSDPAAREAELLEGHDALEFELGEDYFRNRGLGEA